MPFVTARFASFWVVTAPLASFPTVTPRFARSGVLTSPSTMSELKTVLAA